MSPTAHAPSLAHVVLEACMTGPRRRPLGALLVVAAAALWGCWSICFKSAERLSTTPLSAMTESAVVFFVMLVTMVPLAVLSRKKQERAATSSSSSTKGMPLAGRPPVLWALMFALGITDALNALCFFQAMQTTSVAVAVLTHYLTPLIVALLAPRLLGEPRRKSTWVALAIALTGLVLLLRPWADVDGRVVTGATLGAVSAVFYASNVFLGKRLFASFNSFEVAAWPKLSSVLVLVVAGVVAGDGLAVETGPLLVLLAGGLVCGSLPTVLFYAGLQRIAASQASVLTLVEPLVAVLVGVVVWGEGLPLLGVLGGACVLGGAVIIARAQR